MSAPLSDAVMKEMDISAILDAYVYCDVQKENFRGKTLSEIQKMLEVQPSRKSDEDKLLSLLNNHISENSKIGDIRLISQSSKDGNQDGNTPMNKLVACAFQDSNGNVIVSYRGTGDGKWVDNGEGMSKESSLMQQKAAEYFDYVISTNGFDKDVTRIIVSGHSKGGNSAQYATLFATYGYLVDRCYSFDGQGFSQAAKDAIIAKYGQDYFDAQIMKMFGVHGENDYVHDLGLQFIPEDQTYFIRTPGADSIGGYHDLNEMLINGGLNWDFTEQGPYGKFSKELSKNLMTLNQEDIEDSALVIMTLLEKFMGGDNGENLKFGTGERTGASPEEWIGFIAIGIPTIIGTAITSEDARNLIGEMIAGGLADIYNSEHGVWKLLGLTVVTVLVLPTILKAAAVIWVTALIIETISDLVKFAGEKIKQLFTNVCNMVNAFVTGLSNWWNKNFNTGYKYATANPQITLDTYKLRQYASRLNSVNTRLGRLDTRLNNLYWQVGLFDLWRLLYADYKICKSNQISRSASYLNDTATEFENTERNILSQLG